MNICLLYFGTLFNFRVLHLLFLTVRAISTPEGAARYGCLHTSIADRFDEKRRRHSIQQVRSMATCVASE